MDSTNKTFLAGLKDAKKRLDTLGAKVAGNVVRRAVYAGASVVRDAARAKVPVDTGALRASIVAKAGSKKPGEVSASAGVQRKKFTKGAREGKSPRRYAHLVEFGTVNMPAQPFLRPAIDGNKSATLEVTAETIRKGIDDEMRKLGGTR